MFEICFEKYIILTYNIIIIYFFLSILVEKSLNSSELINEQILKILWWVKDALFGTLSYFKRKFAEVVTGNFADCPMAFYTDKYIQNIDGLSTRNRLDWHDVENHCLEKVQESKEKIKASFYNISEALKKLKTLIKNQKACNNTEN